MVDHSGILSSSEAGRKVRAKELSPVELVEGCLSQIQNLNPKFNAFMTVLRDEALAQARAAEQEIAAGKWRGPLHGIPVAVKDFYDTAGIKTTGGFDKFRNRVPDEDAPVVARLKAAGAIIIGKTNMDALGMETTGLTSAFGPVRNPWNVDHVTGGSSRVAALLGSKPPPASSTAAAS
jgi:aspartyl-tRNA(Asn)/glutamyl-tRNA(Gln) amidotransferase subunit A